MPTTNHVISVLCKSNIALSRELKKRLPNFKIHEITAKDTAVLNETTILVGDFDLIGPHVYNLPKIEWIQGTWGGVDALMPFINPNDPPKFPITRFSGKYFGSLMSEYVISNIINHERGFFRVKENQTNSKWITSDNIQNYRALYDLKVGILGVGNIGEKIARTLTYLGSEVHGFGYTANKSFGTDVLSKYYSGDQLPALLKACDYVINVLPNTSDTKGLLNGNVLENCKENGSIFINIGRGSIISEDSLLEALDNKWISAAILDVFEEEPLKPNSRLWGMSNVYITPHVAGVSRAKDIADQFCENLKLFEQNNKIPTRINFKKGY